MVVEPFAHESSSFLCPYYSSLGGGRVPSYPRAIRLNHVTCFGSWDTMRYMWAGSELKPEVAPVFSLIHREISVSGFWKGTS